jgi:nitronate monooxygenase
MVNKSNFRFKEQQVCCEEKVDKNKGLKKWFKALTFIKGMKKLEKAAFSSTYQNI